MQSLAVVTAAKIVAYRGRPGGRIVLHSVNETAHMIARRAVDAAA